MPEPKVFISYAREDQDVAERIYTDLKESGIQVWIDKHSLLPGQNWKLEIEKAIRESTYFLALLSFNSLSKKGYVQKELRKALDILDEMPDTEIFLIPVRLDNCETSHPRLAEIHRVDLFPTYDEGFDKILEVLKSNRNELSKKDLASSVNIDREPITPSKNLYFPQYTSFQKDLNQLIQQAASDFADIKGKELTNFPNGSTSYASNFSFEYSTNNIVWQRNNSKWYFTCSFCKNTSLQQAKAIFAERVKEIKPLLSNEWKFEEREQPNYLNKIEFEAIKRYNTLRIRVTVVAYDNGNNTQVDFTLEQS